VKIPLADQTVGSPFFSQEPTAYLHPDPHKSSPHPSTLLNIHCNILFPFMHSCLCLSFLIIRPYMLHVPPILSLVCTNDAGRREQIMRNIIMHVSPACCCCISPLSLNTEESCFTSRPVNMKFVVDKLALALVWGKL